MAGVELNPKTEVPWTPGSPAFQPARSDDVIAHTPFGRLIYNSCCDIAGLGGDGGAGPLDSEEGAKRCSGSGCSFTATSVPSGSAGSEGERSRYHQQSLEQSAHSGGTKQDVSPASGTGVSDPSAASWTAWTGLF